MGCSTCENRVRGSSTDENKVRDILLMRIWY